GRIRILAVQSGHGAGPADVVALPVVHSVLHQHSQGGLVGNVLRGRPLAQGAGDLHDGPHEMLVDRVGGEIADEGAVDLQVIDGQLAQRCEGGKANAEVVQGEAAAYSPQRVHEVAGSMDVLDGGR